MKSIFITISLSGLALLLATCKQQEASPCKEPTADFTMMENYPVSPFGFTTYDTDTAEPAWIQFTALEPNAKYEWKIGTDTTAFTKQQFMLDFSPYYTQYYPNVPPVTVTLKVTKSPGSCFPASDSVKYMTRTLYLTEKNLVNGTFKGRFDFDSSFKTVHINIDTTEGRYKGFFITSLPGNDSLFTPSNLDDIAIFYRKAIIDFLTYNGYDNHIEKGEIMVSPDNKHIFIWMKQNNPKLPLTYTFTGTRID